MKTTYNKHISLYDTPKLVIGYFLGDKQCMRLKWIFLSLKIHVSVCTSFKLKVPS